MGTRVAVFAIDSIGCRITNDPSSSSSAAQPIELEWAVAGVASCGLRRNCVVKVLVGEKLEKKIGKIG